METVGQKKFFKKIPNVAVADYESLLGKTLSILSVFQKNAVILGHCKILSS